MLHSRAETGVPKFYFETLVVLVGEAPILDPDETVAHGQEVRVHGDLGVRYDYHDSKYMIQNKRTLEQ